MCAKKKLIPSYEKEGSWIQFWFQWQFWPVKLRMWTHEGKMCVCGMNAGGLLCFLMEVQQVKYLIWKGIDVFLATFNTTIPLYIWFWYLNSFSFSKGTAVSEMFLNVICCYFFPIQDTGILSVWYFWFLGMFPKCFWLKTR